MQHSNAENSIKLTDCGIVISVIDLQCSNADEQIDVIDEGIDILVSLMHFLIILN